MDTKRRFTFRIFILSNLPTTLNLAHHMIRHLAQGIFCILHMYYLLCGFNSCSELARLVEEDWEIFSSTKSEQKGDAGDLQR